MEPELEPKQYMLEKEAPQPVLLASNSDLSAENIAIPEEHIQEIAGLVAESDAQGTWPEMAEAIALEEYGYDATTARQVARFVSLELAERSTQRMLSTVDSVTEDMTRLGQESRQRILDRMGVWQQAKKQQLPSDFPPPLA